MATFAKQRDLNEPPIVAALRRAGASVTLIPGFGVPDLLVGYQEQTFLLEVKHPLKARGGKNQYKTPVTEVGGGELSEAQVRWWKGWRGREAKIVRTPDEALAAIGAPCLADLPAPSPKVRAARKPRKAKVSPHQTIVHFDTSLAIERARIVGVAEADILAAARTSTESILQVAERMARERQERDAAVAEGDAFWSHVAAFANSLPPKGT
jgi:hypothetical protein